MWFWRLILGTSDMSKWETENHCVSWLRLCPDNRISGEKITGKGRLPTNNRATIALKMAASTLRQSDTYLGAQSRRLRTKLGAPRAIKAMAAKLARLVYRMLRYGMKYVDKGAAFYHAEHRQQQIKHLKRKAASLGYEVTRYRPRLKLTTESFWRAVYFSQVSNGSLDYCIVLRLLADDSSMGFGKGTAHGVASQRLGPFSAP